jgi:2-polyprenyl-3-methyl-5-hydroxy-6-metoxy-1,4-benzoquinol methylase
MNAYVLGADAAETARLDVQSAAIERPTRLLLRAAGLAPGMRVIDLGSGLGHLSTIAAEMVGREGRVIGVEASARQIEIAESRRAAAGIGQLSFVQGDVQTWRPGFEADAVIGRLILFHLPDPVATIRHHLQSLRPGGLVVALDYDLGGARAEPPVALAVQLRDWVERAFRAAGAHPTIGARLKVILADAGAVDVQSFGTQEYFAPSDPRGVGLLSSIVRALAPQIVQHGIATAEELGIETLQQRLGDAVRATNAVMLPPTLACAWGRKI